MEWISVNFAGFNIADAAALVIIAVFASVNIKKGFVKAAFGFFPSVIAFASAYFISPPLCRVIKETQIFMYLKEKLAAMLDIKNIISPESVSLQSELSKNMRLPEIVKNSMLEKSAGGEGIINAGAISDYISGYIAGALLGIIVFILVFLIVRLFISQTLSMVDFIMRLPVLNIINTVGGFIIGAVKGVLFIWAFFLVSILFFNRPFFAYIIDLSINSVFCVHLYENNLLIYLLMKVFF